MPKDSPPSTSPPTEALSIKDLGPIAEARIALGDLTVLVGAQATGKSILIQTLKLALDAGNIVRNLKSHGFAWGKNWTDLLTLFFGEGLGAMWTSQTEVTWQGKTLQPDRILGERSERQERAFVIPAQRVISLHEGWPRPFTAWSAGDPYVVKQFSEQVRRLMESGLGGKDNVLFPVTGRMKAALRDRLNDAIFHGAKVQLDDSSLRKRIVLRVGQQQLPFMSWSAGQREFIPLLLGLYWLMPSAGAAQRKGVEWVMIEEPEMGLHPAAISSLLLAMLELVHRGYRVVLSTHSPHVLDVLWVIRTLQAEEADPALLLDLFGVEHTPSLQDLARTVVLHRTLSTWYFKPGEAGSTVADISSLDPGAVDADTAAWGELTGFSGRAAELVSKAVTSRWSQGDT